MQNFEYFQCFDNELGGRFNTSKLMANQQETKKPYREPKPKEKRKPDYKNARSQKRGE